MADNTQYWELVFALKNGQGMQCIVAEQPQDVDAKIKAAGDGVLELLTIHAQHKEWPIYFRLRMSEACGWYYRPHEVYYAARVARIVQ